MARRFYEGRSPTCRLYSAGCSFLEDTSYWNWRTCARTLSTPIANKKHLHSRPVLSSIMKRSGVCPSDLSHRVMINHEQLLIKLVCRLCKFCWSSGIMTTISSIYSYDLHATFRTRSFSVEYREGCAVNKERSSKLGRFWWMFIIVLNVHVSLDSRVHQLCFSMYRWMAKSTIRWCNSLINMMSQQ